MTNGEKSSKSGGHFQGGGGESKGDKSKLRQFDYCIESEVMTQYMKDMRKPLKQKGVIRLILKHCNKIGRKIRILKENEIENSHFSDAVDSFLIQLDGLVEVALSKNKIGDHQAKTASVQADRIAALKQDWIKLMSSYKEIDLLRNRKIGVFGRGRLRWSAGTKKIEFAVVKAYFEDHPSKKKCRRKDVDAIRETIKKHSEDLGGVDAASFELTRSYLIAPQGGKSEIYAMAKPYNPLGEGGFGRVLYVENENGEIRVVKVSGSRSANRRAIEEEKLLNYFSDVPPIRLERQTESTKIPKFETIDEHGKKMKVPAVKTYLIQKNCGLSLEHVEEVTIGMALGMSESLMKFHRKKLVHSDVKAENFCVKTAKEKNTGRVRYDVGLIDFGLVVKKNEPIIGLTHCMYPKDVVADFNKREEVNWQLNKLRFETSKTRAQWIFYNILEKEQEALDYQLKARPEHDVYAFGMTFHELGPYVYGKKMLVNAIPGFKSLVDMMTHRNMDKRPHLNAVHSLLKRFKYHEEHKNQLQLSHEFTEFDKAVYALEALEPLGGDYHDCIYNYAVINCFCEEHEQYSKPLSDMVKSLLAELYDMHESSIVSGKGPMIGRSGKGDDNVNKLVRGVVDCLKDSQLNSSAKGSAIVSCIKNYTTCLEKNVMEEPAADDEGIKQSSSVAKTQDFLAKRFHRKSRRHSAPDEDDRLESVADLSLDDSVISILDTAGKMEGFINEYERQRSFSKARFLGGDGQQSSAEENPPTPSGGATKSSG